MYLISFYGFGLHQQVPDFDGQVVASHHVTSIMTKLHVRYTRYNLRKETPIGGIFWFLKHWNLHKWNNNKIFWLTKILKHILQTTWLPMILAIWFNGKIPD